MDALVEKLKKHEPIPTPEEQEEAAELVTAALRSLALSSSILSSIIMSMMRRVYTSACDTLAVTLGGNGLPVLMVNPEFAKKLGKDGLVFVLAHEAYHLIKRHLYSAAALLASPNWTLATEAGVNRSVMRHLGRNALPIVDGEPSGIDPEKVYESYRAALKKAGITPVDKDIFYSTDLACLAELDRMPRPPRQKSTSCLHSRPSSGDGDGDGEGLGTPVLDKAEVDKLVGQAISTALHEAKANGNKAAADELLQLMDENPQAEKMWGDLGVGSLRGETTRTRKTDLWAKWVADSIASVRDEGTRLQYPRKLAGVMHIIGERLAANGHEMRRQGVVAIDASGSMSSEFLDKVAAIVGDDDTLDIDWISFDGHVWPFKPGETMQGGGGTNFQIIDDYVADLDEEPDFVLVITDGYAPKMTPRDPNSWIWLITPGGDGWAGEAPYNMRCRVIDEI
jgi:hypothetical protein